MVSTLSFDREKHEYRINGTVVPSVTQCLGLISSLWMVKESVLKPKAEFGTKVHRMVELFELGRLNRAALHPLLEKYLVQWIRAKESFKIVVQHTEKQVFSERLGCAGTIDIIGEQDGRSSIIDIKTCPYYREQEIQTAGYKLMAVESGLVPADARRAAVHLSEDEHEIRFHAKPGDEIVFRSLLNITRWQQEVK